MIYEVEPIGIALADPSYGIGGGDDEQNSVESIRRQESLETEFGTAFFQTSNGTGAAAAAFFAWLPSAAIGGAIWLFFQGEKIEPNIAAWKAFYDKYLSRFVSRSPTIDRGGSIVLAVRAICDHEGGDPAVLRLISYKRRSRMAPENAVAGSSGEIDARQDRIEAASIHIFVIEADTRTYTVCVERDRAHIVAAETHQ